MERKRRLYQYGPDYPALNLSTSEMQTAAVELLEQAESHKRSLNAWDHDSAIHTFNLGWGGRELHITATQAQKLGTWLCRRLPISVALDQVQNTSSCTTVEQRIEGPGFHGDDPFPLSDIEILANQYAEALGADLEAKARTQRLQQELAACCKVRREAHKLALGLHVRLVEALRSKNS